MRSYTNNKTIVVQHGSRNITIAGNTISDGNRGIEMRQEGRAAFIQLNNSIKNNLVYQSSSPSIKDAFSNLDIEYNGWFQSSAGALGQDSDTTGSNPLFVDEATDDYRLQVLSPAVNAGVDVGTVFFESAPDLGAFEYNPGGDTTPPNAPTSLSVTRIGK